MSHAQAISPRLASAWFFGAGLGRTLDRRALGAIGACRNCFGDMARALERACFDYLLIEDSSYIGESFGGSREIYLRNGLSVPRQDPSVIATLMAAATSRIGIVPTLSTFAYPPDLLARLVASLDQVSNGRIGWNMVTGSSDFAAMNYGLPGMPEHDLRYDMADEYMAAVNALWDSWEPGAILADTDSGVLVDHTKVHAVNFEGKWFKTRGPLNSGPCVQGRPVIAQAGGSARGRRFAAQHADTIVASVKGVAGMRAYRDDVRAHAIAAGRNPNDIKVLFTVAPELGDTMEEATLRHRQRLVRAEAQVPNLLAHFGKITNIDFGQYDLDTPVDQLDLWTNGHQQLLDEFRRFAGKRSLRQAMFAYRGNPGSIELIGTPDAVASQMAEAMEEAGGDGFLLSLGNVSRRAIAEVADGLVPALQARGLVRRAYEFTHFRDNLRAF
jgi:FMN-dependent oxidoreductase (nitrilotriacetate monooxygenase family)